MASHSPEADAAPWRALFFEMLRKTGNVSAAARHAGRARAQLYRLRKQDTAFAALWDDALEEAADWLELEALRWAKDGTEEGRYFRGEMIGRRRRLRHWQANGPANCRGGRRKLRDYCAASSGGARQILPLRTGRQEAPGWRCSGRQCAQARGRRLAHNAPLRRHCGQSHHNAVK